MFLCTDNNYENQIKFEKSRFYTASSFC